MIVVETFHNDFDGPIDQVLVALAKAGLKADVAWSDDEDQWHLVIQGLPEQFKVVARPDVVYCLRDLTV